MMLHFLGESVNQLLLWQGVARVWHEIPPTCLPSKTQTKFQTPGGKKHPLCKLSVAPPLICRACFTVSVFRGASDLAPSLCSVPVGGVHEFPLIRAIPN
jgi:hypothetical protein